MKGLALNAQLLRILMLIGLAILLIGVGFGFYYSQDLLRGYARETSELNAKAAMSEQNISTLRDIKDYLEDHTEQQQRAASVVAESREYKYQNEIIDDISAFARASGIQITGYTFSEGTAAGGTAAAPASGGPAVPAAGTPIPGAGLKSKTVNIAVKSPVNYVRLLNFIHRIEQNTTKMQISSVSLSRGGTSEETGAGSDPNQVTTDAFDIEVYVR